MLGDPHAASSRLRMIKEGKTARGMVRRKERRQTPGDDQIRNDSATAGHWTVARLRHAWA